MSLGTWHTILLHAVQQIQTNLCWMFTHKITFKASSTSLAYSVSQGIVLMPLRFLLQHILDSFLQRDEEKTKILVCAPDT